MVTWMDIAIEGMAKDINLENIDEQLDGEKWSYILKQSSQQRSFDESEITHKHVFDCLK